MRVGALVCCSLALAFVAGSAHALETDQFYAWKHSLADATDALNEKINAEIGKALARVNSRHGEAACSCRNAREAIRDQFRYLLFARPEMWASKTSRLARFPETVDEETRFEREHIYSETSVFDPIRWMPLSPTIQVAGVRVGTDKIGHFFADGAWIEKPYLRARKKGVTDDEALQHALEFSLDTERSVLGMSSSGVLSRADMEANYQGLLFYRGLCDGQDPVLALTPSGWTLKRAFDFREYVGPEWDESWEANIYSRWRWAKVKPVMQRYCPLLRDPEIRSQRAAYAARERETPTEAIVRKFVAAGKLADPQQFTIDAVCGLTASEDSGGSGR